jgi:hypothetical protein
MKIFLIIGIIGLVIGNIWYFSANDRPLHLSTNVIIIALLIIKIALLIINFVKLKKN